MEKVREKCPNYLFEPIFCGQTSQDCASNFACIGAIMWKTLRESVWSRKIEPCPVSSDNGGRLQLDFFNWNGYNVSSGSILVEKLSFCQQNSNNYSSINFNGLCFIILSKSRARYSRTIECRATLAESGTRNPENQKARKPESQKSRIPVTCHEPVSQWAINQRASEPARQCQRAAEPVSQYQGNIIQN